MQTPRFFIVDPSLKDMRGHHYSLSSWAARSAAGAGLEPWWLSSRRISPGFESPDAKIHPTFGASMYENYKLPEPISPKEKRRNIMQRALSRLGRELGIADNPQKIPPKADQTAAFAEDLMNAVRELAIEPSDRLFFHTADATTYVALAQIIADLPLRDAPIFHVVTPYDPIGVMPNRESAGDVGQAVRTYVDQGFIDEKIFLYGENETVAEHLSLLWAVPVQTALLPAAAPHPDEIAMGREFRRQLGIDDDTFLAISLGAARIEKGFQHFPNIIRSAFKEYGDNRKARLKFVLHASPQIIGRHPEIASTIEMLHNFPTERVELLLEPLSEEDYRSLLLASDAVVLPYECEDYRYRGSAIVTEAIAAGKILIATEGSYPGVAARIAGGLTASTPEGFGIEIARAANEPEPFTAAAAVARDWLVSESSANDYVPKLLRRETAAAKSANVV